MQKIDQAVRIVAKNPAGGTSETSLLETIEVYEAPKIDAKLTVSQRQITIDGVATTILSFRNIGEDVAYVTPYLNGELLDPEIVDFPLQPGPTLNFQWETDAGWPKGAKTTRKVTHWLTPAEAA